MIPALPSVQAAAGRLAAALFQAADTVIVVQQKPGWQSWIEALAAIATIVVAIALLVVGAGVIYAALKVKQLTKKMEEHARKLRVDLAPAITNVNALSEDAKAVSQTVRADAERLSGTVTSANERLRRSMDEAERRVGEFNALIGVVQEEAEELFIGASSALRGLRAGADSLRSGRTLRGRREDDDGYEDEYEEDFEDEFEDEIEDALDDGDGAGPDDEPLRIRVRRRGGPPRA